jgi:hypothetical protein
MTWPLAAVGCGSDVEDPHVHCKKSFTSSLTVIWNLSIVLNLAVEKSWGSVSRTFSWSRRVRKAIKYGLLSSYETRWTRTSTASYIAKISTSNCWSMYLSMISRSLKWIRRKDGTAWSKLETEPSGISWRIRLFSSFGSSSRLYCSSALKLSGCEWVRRTWSLFPMLICYKCGVRHFSNWLGPTSYRVSEGLNAASSRGNIVKKLKVSYRMMS